MAEPPAPELDVSRADLAAVAVDVVVLTVDEGGTVQVVLAPPSSPVAGAGWALPGRRVRADEDLETAARRVLAELAGLADPRHLEQLATFGRPDRDPRGRVVSVSYLALQPAPLHLGGGAAWHAVDDLPALAFDHEEILSSALGRLRARLGYSNVAYGLLPEAFTLSELQAVYTAVLGREVDKRNFRKKVLALGMVVEARGKRRGQHRPAQLYRFAHADLVLHDDVVLT